MQEQEVDERLVAVVPEWNGWRTAAVRLADVHDVHWLEPEGAPRPVLHAYVSCSKIVSGDLEHECRDSATPHRLLVCILKTRNAPGVYSELVRQANQALGTAFDEEPVAASGPLSALPLPGRARGVVRALWLSLGVIGVVLAVRGLRWLEKPSPSVRPLGGAQC